MDRKDSDRGTRPENANILPGGTNNTAGGKSATSAGYWDALKTVKWDDMKEVHLKPCVRESFLFGIGGGFALGGIRAVLGASVWISCNWAVGAFCLGSLMMHEFCQRRRLLERQGMQRVIEVLDRKNADRKLSAAINQAKQEKSSDSS